MFKRHLSYTEIKKRVRSVVFETLTTDDLNGDHAGKGRGNLSLLFCPSGFFRLHLCHDRTPGQGFGASGSRSSYIDPVQMASVEYNGRYFDKPLEFAKFRRDSLPGDERNPSGSGRHRLPIRSGINPFR